MRILAIGAHPDDIELGLGASIVKHVTAGDEVHAIVLTAGAVGIPDGAPYELRTNETERALRHLGCTSILQHDFPDTDLLNHIPQMIRFLEREIASIKPDRVYTMFRDDRHQDHRAVFQASDVACRAVPQILMYETPSAHPAFVPTVFNVVTAEQMQRKREALAMHESQKHRLYMDQRSIAAAGKFRAVQIGVDSDAEAFMAHKFIL